MRKGGQVGLVCGVRGPGVRFRIVGRWSLKAAGKARVVVGRARVSRRGRRRLRGERAEAARV